jgi:MtN3 and saliva related transmembrane protein
MLSNYGVTILGLVAAAMTSLSYLPQAKKAVPRGATEDLSLKMLVVLATGLLLWIGYGFVIGNWVIVLANVVGATLVGFVLVCKLRDIRAGRGSAA